MSANILGAQAREKPAWTLLSESRRGRLRAHQFQRYGDWRLFGFRVGNPSVIIKGVMGNILYALKLLSEAREEIN